MFSPLKLCFGHFVTVLIGGCLAVCVSYFLLNRGDVYPLWLLHQATYIRQV